MSFDQGVRTKGVETMLVFMGGGKLHSSGVTVPSFFTKSVVVENAKYNLQNVFKIYAF